MTNILLSKRVADLTMEDLMVVERAIATITHRIPDDVTFGTAFGYKDPTADFEITETGDPFQMPLTHAISDAERKK
jgi:hypothetical protein